MTSFSILFARFKGDLTAQVEGALALESLRPGDRILISEACSHHPIADDIGRVKIPRWLNQYVGGKLEIDTVQGHDFPEDISPYSLVVYCGALYVQRPSTTALATINKEFGRELGLQRGANIVMPNLTPPRYRALYEIYPEKACVNETAEMCRFCLLGRIESMGRCVGTGPGGRRRD